MLEMSAGTMGPRDIGVLQRATTRAACTLADLHLVDLKRVDLRRGGTTDRERVAAAVLWVARTGYAREGDGATDETALSEAAVARFRSLERAG